MNDEDGLEVATLGGGCFWCLQPVFQELKGVQRVEVGYAGGHVEDPSYREVCTGRTGHAEVVQVALAPDTVSFEEVLEVFFTVHDPTTKDRQGPDMGTQYRSAIFTHGEAQRETAERVIDRLEAEGVWKGIVTEVTPFEAFYRAEEYHQDYFAKNPNQAYCRIYVKPKLEKFRKRFADKRK